VKSWIPNQRIAISQIRLLGIVAAFFFISEMAFGQAMVVSSYFNAGDPRNEWSELLVVQDNLDLRNWSYGDNNSTQSSWQTRINFNNIDFWRYMRAGTIVVIWHRPVNSTGNPYPEDTDPSDGYLQLSANNSTYFNGGDFGTAPTWGGNSLNIANDGDLLQIRNASNTHVHVLGHFNNATQSATFAGLALPKLNLSSATLVADEVVMACPQTTVAPNINQYGTLPPQNGTFYTARSTVDLTFGLPNIRPTNTTTNSIFWRSLRQPAWPTINPSFSVNANNTTVTLSWTPVPDPVSNDIAMGYIILRNTADVFSDPVDGTTYNPWDVLGGATVVSNITPSTNAFYLDNISVPCTGGLYYRIYAYRYGTDNLNGNTYNVARGRAYNETAGQFATYHVTVTPITDPTFANADVTEYCADNPPASITLTTDGSGDILEWFTGSCGGTLIGTGISLTIPPPTATTTYYARWNSSNSCYSECAEVTVTVNPVNNALVSIAASPSNNVCAGTSVTVTATPVSSSSPGYQWYQNGSQVGANQPTYTFTPVTGDQVYVEMTSIEPCSTNPVSSNTIAFTVNPLVTPGVSVNPAAASVCSGDDVTFTANGTNGGISPTINWYVNSVLQGTTGAIFTYSPNDNDQVYAVLTSSEACLTIPTATSNIAVVSVVASYNVAVTIAADDEEVCEGTAVNFTATSVSGGTGLTYEWYVNNVIQAGQTTNTFAYANPVNNAQVYARLFDAASCATGSPATSNTIQVVVSANVSVNVTLSANNPTSCFGSPVVFTAVPDFPGTAPVYEWFVNNVLQSVPNLPTFTLANPSDGDVVFVRLTSNEECVSNNPDDSEMITLTILQNVTPTVELTPDQTSICLGSTVTFTAGPTNEGSAPQYIFHINGVAQPAQANPVFVYAPADGDAFYVTLISNAPCATAINVDSETETITVSTSLPVDIVLPDPGPVCSGNPAIFNATPVNQGANPVYEWYVNGLLAATTSIPTYSNPTPADGDQVFVRLFNNESCATGSPDDSQTITVVLVSSVIPSVAIVPDSYVVCSGSPVVFTANPLNGGSNPVYQWFVDGIEQAGVTGPLLNLSPVADISVYAILQSNALCAVPNTTQSPAEVVTVMASYNVSVTAVPPALPVCEGTTVLITSDAVNQGPAPEYQWYLNGSAVAGAVNPDFSYIPDNGDQVYVELTNNETCAIQNTVQSSVITLAVSNQLVVDVVVNPGQAFVCAGSDATFNAIPQNGGSSPGYAWYVNGVVQTETTAVLIYLPGNGDRVSVMLTSNENCVTNSPATSPDYLVEVITGPAAAVTLTSDAASVCQGEEVVFTAAPVNEGLTPVYRWLVNGVEESLSGNIFSYTPANGDQVTIEMTSSEVCATNNPAIAEETVELSPCGFVMRIPNSFTPNNDQVNDMFKPVLGDILPTKYLLQIFDRWGGIVFETNNPDQGWDGTHKGQKVPRGIYSYKLEFEIPEYISSSLDNPLRGTIILLR
jgi:gliding motility-associated-like protein